MNFDLLRSEGIRHISSLSGDLWTDHNLHDPGITILEVLCYALTDLGYRNSLPVEDLLAKDPDSPTRFLPDDNFFTAAELLTCNPLTILDYRKMLMNIGGVRNAWLELATGEEVLLKTYPEGTPECEKVRLKGLYKVILELDAFAEGKTLMEQEGKVDGILRQATALLHQHRNLCEDFLDIFVLGDEEIGILADLEISPDASPDDVMVEAMVALQEFLSPKVPYYTLKEMIAKGKSMEEIFRGRAFDATEPPSLNGLAQQENFGFIDTEELEQIERKTELHASDFYRIIMDVKGVNAVRSLKLFNFMGGLKQTSGEDWCLRLTARHRAVMSPWLSEVHCFKNGLKFSPDKIKVTKRFKDRISGLVAKTLKPAADLDAALPQGNFRKDLGEYYSIQHEFPLLYRIGIDELPDSAPAELHAKKQQLKGYLLFFDQLLANYLAQLAHLRNLFVLRPHRNEHPDGSLKTIFSQKLDSVPELDTLLRYANQEAALSKTGEVLLEPLPGYLQFSTQEQRELAIRRFISEFEAGGMKVSHRETAKGTFQYVLESLGEVVMASSREYPSANAALAAGEALHFLGAIRDCYALGAPEKTGKFSYTYSFKLVLNPLPYEAYLSQISEKPDQAEDRRTRFLNHLLARFAEEFTDYTLLMYGLEGKKRSEEQIIKDKEIFLSDYPRISRDRGRGFNYQQPKAGNVSGLERRVESLMGITNRERNGGNSLSNIELAAWEPLHFPEIRNTRGDVVFRGVNGFPTAEEAKPEALKIMALAKELKCYSLQHCASKNVFSFQLEDENGNLIARHPLNYESKKKAEKKRSCLLKMAATKGNCFVKVIENKASGYFTLFDGKKKHPGVLFESTKACADVAEARERWLDFVKALDHPAPFVKVENEQGGNFSFIVANEQGEPIARHPKWYCTSKGRMAAMQKWEAYLREKKLRPRIETKPVFYRWQLFGTGKRLPLLESLPRFESEAQAVANYEWFLNIAIERSNWEMRHEEESDRYGFVIKEKGGYEAARSQWYHSKKECEEALAHAQKLLAEEAGWEGDFRKQQGFRYALKNKGKTLLQSLRIYRSPEDARIGWEEMWGCASDPALFSIEQALDDACTLQLFNRHRDLIAQADFSTCEDATQAIKEIGRLAKRRPKFETTKADAFWGFDWKVKKTKSAKGKAGKLESAFLYESRTEALEVWQQALRLLRAADPPSLTKPKIGDYFSLLNEQKDEVIRFEPASPLKDPPVELLIAWAKALPLPFLETKRSECLHVTEFPEQYTFILVGENGAAAMVGGQLYDSIEAAEWAFYQFTEKAAKPKNYVLEREEGSCRFTFAIPTPYCGYEATHPVWYPNKALAKKAMYDLAAFVEANRLHFKVDFAPVSWRPELHWENTEGACVPVLIGENRRKKGEAEDEAGNWADIISEKAEALRATCKKGCFSFRLRPEKEGAILARHPVFYSSAAGRDKMLKSARGLRIESSGWRHTTVVEWTKPSTEQGNFGFRMVKSGGSLASHPQTYSKAKKRDAIFDELIVLGKAGALVVSEISATEKSAFFLGKNKWTFVIRGKRTDRSFCPGSNEDKGGGKVWWQSVKGFYSETEAKKAFDKDFLDILRLASNAANYKICSLANCKWEVVLLGDDTSAVAKIPELFTSEKAARRAVEERVVNAKTYPFFRECDQWRFRILSIGAEEDTVLWESGGNFSTIADAAKELYRFLHAATYPGNYFRKDNASAGRFGIEMREVQLESSFKSATRENAWLQADEFSLLADEEGAFYPFVAPDDVCRYGLRVVRQNYVLARHIRRYHSADLQEAALHGLHAEARNRLVGASRLSTGFCRKGEEIYLNITDNDAGAVIWRSASGFPPGAVNAAEHATRHYLGSTDQPEAYRNFYLTLYEYARHADFYQIMQEAGQKFRLALFNPDGRIELLTTKTFPTKEECEAEANRLIRLFRRYPVLKEEEQYYFQYYSFDEAWALSEEEPQSGIFDTGKIIWESSLAYASATEASEAFERFTILLADKSNYQRISEKGNRYFSIELTDPEAILAVHPLTYCTKEEVQNLAGDIRATLDGEGLHLLEHILFRPKNKGAFTGNYLIKTCAKEQPDIHFSSPVLEVNRCGKMVEKLAESCFRPYADPYSFWMTVVLPYWPKRFQNLDFRKFFENTLRRETPAHIALKIVWVGPEQMHLFETKYHAWLAALGLEGDCLRGSAQDDFMEFLFEEIQQGNPPILLDTTDKSQQIILDESRLTL